MMEMVAPLQLSLPFDNPLDTMTTVVEARDLGSLGQRGVDVVHPTTVLDFHHAYTRRETQKSSAVYRKILDSVRHIG